MNKFAFGKKEPKVLKVEINGKAYSFNPYTLTVQKASEKFVKCQRSIIDSLGKKPSQKELDRIVLKACSLVRETVNQILGKGSYEKIFSGRTVDFKEHQKLMEFLFEEITKFCKENPNPSNDEYLA